MARSQDLNFESSFSASITTAAGELTELDGYSKAASNPYSRSPTVHRSDVLNLPHLNPLSKESLT